MTRGALYLLAWIVVLIFAAGARGSDLPAADALVHSYAPAAAVSCDPALRSDYYAETFILQRRVIFGPLVCLGLFLYGADPGYRIAVQKLNPTMNIEQAIGVGLVVALHESQHAAGIRSETIAQCRAMAYAKPLLATDPIAWANAQRYDAMLPSAYHDGSACDV